MFYFKPMLVMYVDCHVTSCSSASILQPRHGCPLTSVVRPQVGKLAVVATTPQTSVAPTGTKLVTLRTTGKKLFPVLNILLRIIKICVYFLQFNKKSFWLMFTEFLLLFVAMRQTVITSPLCGAHNLNIHSHMVVDN